MINLRIPAKSQKHATFESLISYLYDMPAMKNICIIGAATAMDREELKHKLQKAGVLGVDSRMICGKDHLLAAANSAANAFDSGKNICSTMPMEIMLYASGERQISKAADKMSIKDCKYIALVIFDEEVEFILSQFGMNRDDSLLEASDEKIKNYGISSGEMSSVPAEKKYDLVLERVAFATLRNK